MPRSKPRQTAHPPECRICHRPAVPKTTEEHAYPDWFLRWVTRRQREGALLPGLWLEQQKSGIAKLLLKPVCRSCQEKMRVRFENRGSELLKEMLEGTRLTISADDLKVLAGWCVKTAIVVAFARGARGEWRDITPANGERLRTMLVALNETGEPPASCIVRLASASAIVTPTTRRFLPPAPHGPPDPNVLSTLVVLTPAVVVEATIGATQAYLEHYLEVTASDPRFMRIWPSDGNFSWPPTQAIALEDISRLQDQLSHAEPGRIALLTSTRLPPPFPNAIRRPGGT